MKVRNIKSFFYQNKVFFLFVCLQMIILLYFLYGLVSAKNSLEIPTESTGGIMKGQRLARMCQASIIFSLELIRCLSNTLLKNL